jgi:hypothetical protein
MPISALDARLHHMERHSLFVSPGGAARARVRAGRADVASGEGIAS